MTAAQLKQLKDMAQELVDDFAIRQLTVDGRGVFYQGRESQMGASRVLEIIADWKDKVYALNDVIQHLEGRKEAKK